MFGTVCIATHLDRLGRWGQWYEVQQSEVQGPALQPQKPCAVLRAGVRVAGKLCNGKESGDAGQHQMNMSQHVLRWPRRPMAS